MTDIPSMVLIKQYNALQKGSIYRCNGKIEHIHGSQYGTQKASNPI
jgi:hypothetical protein